MEHLKHARANFLSDNMCQDQLSITAGAHGQYQAKAFLLGRTASSTNGFLPPWVKKGTQQLNSCLPHINTIAPVHILPKKCISISSSTKHPVRAEGLKTQAIQPAQAQ